MYHVIIVSNEANSGLRYLHLVNPGAAQMEVAVDTSTPVAIQLDGTQLDAIHDRRPIGLREQLVGAWRLVSYEEHPLDGAPIRHPMTKEPKGLILYTPDGFMSAQLMMPGRTPFASGDWFDGTDEAFREEASGYIAYSGSFQVDEMKGTLTHSMFVSLFPNWIGQTQPRLVEICGDTLNLSTASPIRSGGRDVMARLCWKRAERAN